MLHPSGIQWVILVVLSIVWAALGYRLSENDRKRLGRTPWGLPSVLWAFFWFLSLVLGLVLYLIAHSNGVRRARQGLPVPGSPPATGWAMTSPSVAEQFPAYPQPANSQAPPPVDVRPAAGQTSPGAPGVPGAPAPSVPTSGTQAPAGPWAPGPQGVPLSWPHSPPAWHPDPSGRFHYRWWDGYQWTSQVSTDGHHLIDTNPDQRIGPY